MYYHNIFLFFIICILCKLKFVYLAAIVKEYYTGPTYVDNQVYYEYKYTIEDRESGVITERWEMRLGDYVKGRYSFVEPNGFIRTVNYEVDGEKGYRPVVQTNPPGENYLSRKTYLESLSANG